MTSREDLLAAGPRAYILIAKATKVPVASADGVRQEIRQVRPGDLLPRADWDRFPERSRRSMTNAGFVKDPLSVRIDPITNRPEALPGPKASVTVLGKNGRDRRLEAQQHVEAQQPVTAIEEPPKRKRGRPRKVRI